MKRYRKWILLSIPAFLLLSAPVFASHIDRVRDDKDSLNPVFDLKKVRVSTADKRLSFEVEEYDGVGSLVLGDNGQSRGLSAVFNINCDDNSKTGWVDSYWNAKGAEYQLGYIAKKYNIGADRYVLQNILLEEWNGSNFVTVGTYDILFKNGVVQGQTINGVSFKKEFNFSEEEALVSVKLSALPKCTSNELVVSTVSPGFIDSPRDYIEDLTVRIRH